MFDWKLYQDNKIIEEYLDIKTDNNIYLVNDKLYYDFNLNRLVRENLDFSIIIDFNLNSLLIKSLEGNFEGKMNLIKSRVNKVDNEINIIYQIDSGEPINKIVIRRRTDE